jgi:hypothetical protein
MVVCRLTGILSRLYDGDADVRAVDLSTRDDLEFHSLFPPGTQPDRGRLPPDWCAALARNTHVRTLCLYASFLDTVDEDPARHSRFAVLMELFSHLPSLQELEIHAFSVPTRIFPVRSLTNLLHRQATCLRKLSLFNIRSEGIPSHTEGFRDQLAQAMATLTSLEEIVWEPFPLLEPAASAAHHPDTRLLHGPLWTTADADAQRALDEALLSAIVGLPRLRKLVLCARSVNLLSQPVPPRLPFGRPCLQPQWNQSRLDTIHISGYTLHSDDLRVLLGIATTTVRQHRSRRRSQGQSPQSPVTAERQLKELHLTQCLLEEPAALLEYLKVNCSLRRLVLSDTCMGLRSADYPLPDNNHADRMGHPSNDDPYQQRDFVSQIIRILEWPNTTLHWVATQSPHSPKETRQHQTLETLLQWNRSGLRHLGWPQDRPSHHHQEALLVWPVLLHKLGHTSPTVLLDLLQRNADALLLLRSGRRYKNQCPLQEDHVPCQEQEEESQEGTRN